MSRITSFLVGAGLMYLFDPDRGRQRRTRLGQQVVHTARAEKDLLRRGIRDARQRAKGVSERARRVFSEPAPDAVVLGRIRAQLGRAISHARVIDIEVREGRVILRGPVLMAEAATVLRTVKTTPGVREVVDRLEKRM